MQVSKSVGSSALPLRKIMRNAMLYKMTRHTTVVDVTYKCNALCSYCRWGDGKTGQRTHQSLDDILICDETLKNLGIRRIVLSGGEPRLHPEFESIVSHYAKLVDDVIVITNGYGLAPKTVKQLQRAGVTGILLSLDSTDCQESHMTRLTPPKLHGRILEDIKEISKISGLEVGINSTVSHVTANWSTVRNLLEFGRMIELDYIKFQPIFDDGYASKNAPTLLLTSGDVTSLMEISAKIASIAIDDYPLTNPSGFWRDVAVSSSGKQLLAGACGLGSHQSISVQGNLSMCYWMKESYYGATSTKMEEKDVVYTQAEFEILKQGCNVDNHCFCTQRIDHVWT